MAGWTILKAAIADIIKTNGNQEITGQLLQNVLNNIVSSVGEKATFAGIATPTTNPGTPDGPVFYIASSNGVYSNFAGLEVKNAGLYIIYNSSSGSWLYSKVITNYVSKTLGNSTYFDVVDDKISAIHVHNAGTSINASNLISIPKSDFICYNVAKTTNSGAFSVIPGVMIFDKEFNLIKAIFNKESTTIEVKKDELPSGAMFFVMQSSANKTIAYTDFAENNNSNIYDTGISLYYVLKVKEYISTEVSAVADSVSEVADSVSAVADSVSVVADSVSNVLTTTTNRSDSSYYISSKLFPLGGKAKAINFSDNQYSEYAGKKVKVIVGSYLQDSNKMLIRHISEEITVTGKTVDISLLNISVPLNGLIGIFNDSGIYSYYGINYEALTFLGNASSMVEGNTIAAAAAHISLSYNVEVEENVSGIETLNIKIESLANTLQAFQDLFTTTTTTTNLPKVTTKGSQNVNPVSWIASRIIIFGAKVTKANFFTGSEELQGTTAYVVVGQMINDTQAKIISRTAFEVNGTSIDLSDLDISVPENGVVGINIDGSSATYGYSTNRPSDLKGKVFVATGATAVNNIVTQHNKFSYLNFPFNVEIIEKELIIDELDKRITALENKEDVSRDFSDKVCVIMGDSITWYGHDDLSGIEGWTHYFKDWFNFKSIRSYARSGATWSCTADTEYDIVENTGSTAPNNVGYNQMNRLLHDIEEGTQETPDYIIIALGTNDAWHRYSASAEGGVDAVKELFNNTTDYEQDVPINTCLTTAMAIRYFSDMVTNNLPNAQIILLTPLQSSSISYNNIISIGDIIEECAKYCSYPIIRQDKECGVYRIQEARDYVNTKDGTHLSSTGAEKVGNYLAQKIKSLLR